MNNDENLAEIITIKDKQIAELELQLEKSKALVRFYEEQFRLMKARQFCSSSEKPMHNGQPSLFGEAENVADVDLPELEKITYTRQKRRGKRADDLSGLPVETVVHTLPEKEQVCPECGEKLHEMGHEIRRELKIIPAQVKVVEHNRTVYSCRNCEKNSGHVPVVKAPMPEPVIKGSLASPSAVSHIMTQKYVMYAPLYRQEQDWKRQGVALSRQTMANWVIISAEAWLRPLYDRMRSKLLQQEVIHGDETTIQVLHEPDKSPTSKSYMWLYRTSGDTKRHIIIFEYQPSRASIHPKAFLAGFKGFLHCDGYQAYHLLPPEIIIIGCWGHMRRKFTDSLKAIPAEQRPSSVAQEAIQKIGYLFHLEGLWENLDPQERYTRRLKESRPLAEAFFVWLTTLGILPQSSAGKAIHYALEQQRWLMNVYLDGRTEISNNRIENSVRPFALGRKNFLFCNTVNGANASAIVYSIIETAKANGLKPFEYLKFLFETLPNCRTSAIDALLPWGDMVPEHCKMPISKEGARDAEKERNEIHDGVCSGVS